MSPYCCSSLNKAIENLLQCELIVAKARMCVIHVNQQLPAISLWIRDVRHSITSKHLGNAEMKSITSPWVSHQAAGKVPPQIVYSSREGTINGKVHMIV